MAPTSVALAVRSESKDRDDASPVGVDPIIAEARRRWKKCEESEDAQRKSILAAKKFRSGDQWPEAIRLQREGSSSIQGVAAQPARPCLTIDRLSQPIRQLSNQIKQAAFSIDVLPNGFGSSSDVAEIYQGYLRRVQTSSRADSPVEWAADGAIEGGIGWFRIRADYVHETWDGEPDDPAAYDQELKLERITNNLSVACDPSALRPTRSDALFMFVTEDLDRDEFKSRWPDADTRSLDDFMSTGDMKGWADKDIIRIAEYWRITFEDVPIEGGGNKRVIRKPVVEGFKITATEVLESWDWLGSRIPLIPILGEEINVDGRPVLRGVIQEGMDAQRMLNYTYSGAIEIFSLGNKAPWKAATGAVDNYRDIWQNANTANYSWLPWDAFDEMGRPMPEPKRENSEPPIEAAVALMLRSEEAIKATTGVYDPSLEYNNPREHSGKAIQALQANSELTGSNYPMHVQRALVYAGELMVEIIPKLTRPGQILQIMGQDEEPEQIMAGQPFQKAPGGVPQPVPEGQFNPDLHDFYDLTKGKYQVTVTVGKGSATRREEGAAALGALIPNLPPEMAAVATPDYVEQLSFPGSHKIAEKLRKVLPPNLQDQEEGGPDPEKQALQQQVQQLMQALESKQVEEQAKQQAQTQRELAKADMDAKASLMKAQQDAQTTLQKAQIDNQTAIHLEEMKNATAIRVAEINAATKGYLAEAQHAAQHEQQALNLSDQQTARATEAHEAENQRAHEQQMADRQAEQAMTQQATQQGHELTMAEQAAQQQESAE